MKKTVKAGVLTGLILVPGAVVSANGAGVATDGTPTESIVESSTTCVIPNNTDADLQVNKLRLEEIFKLNEKSSIEDFQKYREYIGDILCEDKYKNDVELLTAKLYFLEYLHNLKNRASSLTNQIGLLKPTHPTLFETVLELEAEKTAIWNDFIDYRAGLDTKVNTLKGKNYGLNASDEYPEYKDKFEKTALNSMEIYLKTPGDFQKEFINNIDTLNTFIKDIKNAKAFIYSVPLLEDDAVYVADLVDYDKLEPDASERFKQLIEAANKYYEKMTPNEKKIADSHVLKDGGPTVGTILNTAKNDIKQADIVNALLDEIQGKNVGNLKSKVQTVITKYGNLSERQKVLVPDYESIIEGEEGTTDKAGYKDVLDIIDTINTLKNRKNTQEYRDLARKTKDIYDKLSDELKEYVSNYDILDSIISDLDLVEKGEKTVNGKVEKYPYIENLIDEINSIENINAARALYDSLTKDQKKLVINYKELQNFEKLGKTTIKLSDQIDVIEIVNTKTFASKIDKLNASYEKLSEDEKLSEGEKVLIENNPSLSRLKYLTPFANVTGKYHALKTTAKTYNDDVRLLFTALKEPDTETPDTGKMLREELNKALSLLDATITANKNKQLELKKLPDDEVAIKELQDYEVALKKLEDDEVALEKLRDELFASVEKLASQLTNADGVIALINAANGNFDNKNVQLEKIQEAREKYNALPKEEQKLVTNLKTLTELEKVVKQPLAVMKSIDAADPENISKFPSAAKSAVSAFEKLTQTQRSYLSQDYHDRIADFKVYLAFVDQMKALKPSAAGFQAAYEAAFKKYGDLTKDAEQNNLWSSTLESDIIKAVQTYESTLKGHKDLLDGGQGIYTRIEKLGGLPIEDFLKEITEIDADYAALPSNAKKQVTNYKQFQQLKKDSAAASKVVDLINDDDIYNVNVAASSYVKKVESAIKALERLTSNQKAIVYNEAYLGRNLPIYEIVKAINNLKPSAKTYIEDIAAVRQMYNRLTPANQSYLAPILYKIEGAETGLVTVNEVMDLIDAARPGVEDYVQKLTEAREKYDKLARVNSGYQKLVLNYKTLTNREKELKPVTTAIYQIKELEEILARPMINSNELVKKYNNAVKAYEKIPYESRELVYNREVLLSTLYPVSKTVEAIANIKPSSKTFAEDVKKARDWYNSLTSADQARVSNYRDLVALENTVSGGSDVDELIRQLPSTPPTQYMQAIKDARAKYDALTANEKRAVALYKELQNYEKGVKNVQATIDAIDNLQYASNLVSAYDKATKALDKLTADQRQMVPNMNKLRSVGPAIDVYKMIASLKPSNTNYAGTVQAAYSAYNMLSSTEKQYVTNFATLQEAKNNADSVQTVISKIAGISPTSRNYAKQVEEALAMYNSLPSAVRKLVTNYDALKSSKKEADTVDKVRQLISEINPNASNFESKLKSARSAYDKLSTQQKRLVSNYFLLEDYEAQLNNSSFFF